MFAEGLNIIGNLNIAVGAEKRIIAQDMLRRTLRLLLAGGITEVSHPSFRKFIHGL